MDMELKKGKSIPCPPLQWQKKALDALHEGMEAYMVGVMGDVNLLANPCPEGDNTALGHPTGS